MTIINNTLVLENTITSQILLIFATSTIDSETETEFWDRHVIPTDFVERDRVLTTSLPSTDSSILKWDATNSVLVIDNPTELLNAQTAAKPEIDSTAETTRLKYITTGSGQSNTYAEKASQAQKYVDLGTDPDPAGVGFELVQAEADALTNSGTTTTPRQAADSILATRTTWLLIAADIERERRQGKLNVDAAVDATAVTTAKDAAITALETL